MLVTLQISSEEGTRFFPRRSDSHRLPLTYGGRQATTHLLQERDESRKIATISDEKLNLRKDAIELWTLMGKNGAKKSIFGKILIGFLAPVTGEIIFDGSELKNKDSGKVLQTRFSI